MACIGEGGVRFFSWTLRPTFGAMNGQYLTMRTLFSCLLLSLNLGLFAQTEAEALADIRQKFTHITQAKEAETLKTVTRKYTCEGDPISGAVVYFYEGEALRLILNEADDGSHSWMAESFYVWNGEVFFVFKESGYWTFDSQAAASENGQMETVDYTEEARYYFVKGEAIRCLEKSFEVRSADADKPTADTVPNEAVDCGDQSDWLQRFAALRQYQNLSGTDEVPCAGF